MRVLWKDGVPSSPSMPRDLPVGGPGLMALWGVIDALQQSSKTSKQFAIAMQSQKAVFSDIAHTWLKWAEPPELDFVRTK
ncbi:MAG: hypothetical protein ACREML_12145 [Vulcanimicrobiaceae bacterium]